MAVPVTNISLLGLRREFADNDYGSSTDFTDVSLGEISGGSAGTVNRLNPILRSSARSAGRYSIGDFKSYDHNFDFILAAIKFNDGKALFSPSITEADEYEVSKLTPYAKAYLAEGAPYVTLKKLQNNKNRYSTLISSEGDPVDIERNKSVSHSNISGTGQSTGNGPVTYDYPNNGEHAYKGTLHDSMSLRKGSTFQILRIELNSSSSIIDFKDLSNSAFKNNSNYIPLDILLENNYDYSSWGEGVYVLVFNFGKWTYRKGPRNIKYGEAGIQEGIRYSEFQIFKAKVS